MPSDTPTSRRRVPAPFPLSVSHVDAAFAEQPLALEYWNQSARFRVVEVAELVVTSGVVVASDPQFGWMAPLQRRFTPGAYPVSLALLHLASGDERIAFARMLLSSAAVVAWEPAWHEAIPQPAAPGSPQQVDYVEHAFYYSEVGAGGFMDGAAVHAIRKWESQTYIDYVSDGFESNYRPTWSWFSFRPDPARSENVVCYQSEPSGRATYLGLDSKNDVAVILVDCGMFRTS